VNIAEQISARTKLYVLLGQPVAHSLSPQIHNTLFTHYGNDGVYVVLDLDSLRLEAVAQLIRHGVIAGANVTIPHKAQAAAMCDRLSDISRITQTVNTLYRVDGSLCGTTTDPLGFMRAVEPLCGDVSGKNVVICGNGGTAQTLLLYLCLKTRANCFVLGRNETKISALAQQARQATGISVSCGVFNTFEAQAILQQADLVANCTPLGMHPHTDATPISVSELKDSCCVFDAIYNPLQTTLIQQAQARGLRCCGGLDMLVHQAVASHQIWTAQTIDASVIDRKALGQHLH